MRSYPMGDMRDRCAGYGDPKDPTTHAPCEGEKCDSECFVRIPNTEPRSGRRSLAVPKKFKSKLHKKMHKMEVAFDDTAAREIVCPKGFRTQIATQKIRQARINKSAESLQGKIDLLEGKEKKKDGKTDKDSEVS